MTNFECPGNGVNCNTCDYREGCDIYNGLPPKVTADEIATERPRMIAEPEKVVLPREERSVHVGHIGMQLCGASYVMHP